MTTPLGKTLILFSIVFALCSCNSTGLGGSTGFNYSTNAPPSATVQSEALINTTTVRLVSLSVCQNCHRGSQAPNLITADDIRGNINSILFQVNNNLMPPPSAGYAPLTECQKQILNRWAQMAMPDVSSVTVLALPACQAEVIR